MATPSTQTRRSTRWVPCHQFFGTERLVCALFAALMVTRMLPNSFACCVPKLGPSSQKSPCMPALQEVQKVAFGVPQLNAISAAS